jgi:hypothetical protein
MKQFSVDKEESFTGFQLDTDSDHDSDDEKD